MSVNYFEVPVIAKLCLKSQLTVGLFKRSQFNCNLEGILNKESGISQHVSEKV